MTVEPIANGCLRVWLTDEELEHWGLQESAPSPGRVRRLVRRVTANVGWADTERVTAELIPVDGGGILLIGPQVSVEDTPLVYRLQDEDALLDILRRWGDDGAPLCSLYIRQGGYDWILYPDGPLSLRRQNLLAEYGSLIGCGAVAAARCEEYGQPVWAGAMLTARVPTPPEPQDPRR